MNYHDAMTQMKLGHVAKREGWHGHVRVEGLCIVRVKPGVPPSKFCATAADRAAIDWVASVAPARTNAPATNVAAFIGT